MKKQYLTGVALFALTIPGAAMAQSTGSIDFDNEIIVTGNKIDDGLGGVVLPESTKAKAVLTQEFIARQAAGQTVNDIINQLPGVSFQNNDPYGSAGGTMTIRGFDSTRISQTFDGIPLNDSGNYALYSNQQVDSELIEQVNVNLGTTDVDSPTAAASGSTVNYRTRNPYEELGGKVSASFGKYNFRRVFGSIDTGAIGPWGTRAFFSASGARNDNVYNNRGKIDKQQYNAKIYQPIGDNGDFISVAGHYNQNRNNFFGSVSLRTDNLTTSTVPNRFPVTKDERFYTIARCTINQAATPGIADAANSCGSTFDERYNPSNTGNVRVASKFTLAEGLVLNIEPSFQYVKANGGGGVVGREGFRDVNPTSGVSNQTGYFGGTPYYGRDLNGDGDILDTIRVLAPSQTQTKRWGVIAGLRYSLNDNHSVRIAYSFDRARHRQTGETGFLQVDGEPTDVFPVNDGLKDGLGNILQKRDRLSYAILNQISGEYKGKFFDEALRVNIGIRAPFFKRDLTNNCATSSPAGFVECTGTNTAALAAYLANNPSTTIGTTVYPMQGPQQRVLKYNKVLPNLGLSYNITDEASLNFNYSKGIQVPGTDSLYNSFYFPANTAQAKPTPETTDNFDLGVKYQTSKLQMQLVGWYTKYTNRLASAYDPDLDRSVYRNLGTVNKYGIDGDISYSIIPQLQVRLFGSYLKSKIKDDLLVAELNNGTKIYSPTAGKRESGAPVFTFGGRIQGDIGPLALGLQAKRTGKRYVNDSNLPIYKFGTAAAPSVEIYPAATPAYTLVDFDARFSLEGIGLNDKSYLQLNVTNVFDKLYVGGFSGGNQSPNYNLTTGAITGYPSPIFVQIGAPRTVMGSLVIAF